MTAVRRVAGAANLTEGQTYTLAIGLALALTTAAIGIPPTLRDRVEQAAQRRPAPVASAPVGDATAPTPAPPSAPSYAAPSAPPFAGAPAAGTFTTTPTPSHAGPAPAEPSYADGGDLGDVSVLASVDGPARGIAVDGDTGAFYVATEANGIKRFSPAGQLDGTIRLGDRRLTGLIFDGSSLVVLDAAASEVLRVDPEGGAPTVVATIESAGLGRPNLHGVVADGTGNLFVSDAGQGTIWKVDATGEVTEWLRDPQLLSPAGNGPAGMHAAPDGSLVVAVGRSVVALTGAVYRIPVGADGAAGTPEQVWRSDPDAMLTGIAVAEDGRIYVAAANTDTLVVLDADGTEVTTVTSPELDGPYGLAIRGRSVLVTAGDRVARAATG